MEGRFALVRKSLVVLIGVIAAISVITLYAWTGKSSINPEANTRHFTFSYQLNIDNIPSDTRNLEIWIPFPPSNEHQEITGYEILSKLTHDIYVDPVYGNHILHFKTSDRIPERVEVRLDFDVTRSENNSYAEDKDKEHSRVNSDSDLARFLAPNELVPVGGKIAEEAGSVVDDNMTTLEKVQKLYRHLTETMSYDKTGEGWGNGDAVYACDYRRGNCTDIHSLFIGLARSLDIPARFVIGFPLPENEREAAISGYHCWAEFYLDEKGWIPVDISEAIKHPEKKEYYFGRLDPNRLSFTIGRDIVVKTELGSQRLNYFIYPYVLVDGKPFADAAYRFSFTQK